MAFFSCRAVSARISDQNTQWKLKQVLPQSNYVKELSAMQVGAQNGTRVCSRKNLEISSS